MRYQLFFIPILHILLDLRPEVKLLNYYVVIVYRWRFQTAVSVITIPFYFALSTIGYPSLPLINYLAITQYRIKKTAFIYSICKENGFNTQIDVTP